MDWLTRTGGPVLSNVAGRGLNFAEVLNALGSTDPTALQRYYATQSSLLQDPAVRGTVQQSPFLGGVLGQGLERAGVLPAGVQGPQPSPSTPLTPTLPPLTPKNQLEQTLAGAQAQAVTADPTTYARLSLGLGVPLSVVAQNLAVLKELRQFDPNVTSFDPNTGAVRTAAPHAGVALPGEQLVRQPDGSIFVVDPATGQPTRVFYRARNLPGANALATADLQAQQLGFTGAKDPRYTAWLQNQAGISPTPGTPVLSPVSPPGTPGVPALDVTPSPQVPSRPSGAASPPTPVPTSPLIVAPNTKASDLPEGPLYPSPAFGAGPSAAPTSATPSAPVVAPPAVPSAAIPAGETRGMKIGPLTIRKSGPKATPAVLARGLAGEASAAQAARAALALLRAGPQHPLQVGGLSVNVPHLAGPVSGRVLQRLAKVSDQPLAVEEAQLAALVAHARTGIFGITGLRPNVETLHLFDPLMPNVDQPTEILETHLERLASFYDLLVKMQVHLENLSDEQQRAFLYPLFKQHMTASDGSTPPPIIDLRPAPRAAAP